jgi:hypothetical protein
MDQKIAWASAHIGATSVGGNDREWQSQAPSVQNWRSRDYLRSNCGLAFSCTLARTCKHDNRRVLPCGHHQIPQKSEEKRRRQALLSLSGLEFHGSRRLRSPREKGKKGGSATIRINNLCAVNTA